MARRTRTLPRARQPVELGARSGRRDECRAEEVFSSAAPGQAAEEIATAGRRRDGEIDEGQMPSKLVRPRYRTPGRLQPLDGEVSSVYRTSIAVECALGR